MRDERKKQARSNKQTRRSNTANPRQSLFLEKNELPRVGLEPTTLMYRCAVLLCFVCLFDLDCCCFLSSFSSLIKHDTLYSRQSALPTELPRQLSWLGPNLTSHMYMNMQDLLALEATATGLGPQCFKPATPLSVPAWQQVLESHPDRYFVEYILSGIGRGFHIGADRARLVLKQSPMHKCVSMPLLWESMWWRRGLRGGLGPLPPQLARLCHTSPIGLIPKPHQPGRWRLIVDLPSPHDGSVNDAISVDHCHMHYASVLHAAAMHGQTARPRDHASKD